MSGAAHQSAKLSSAAIDAGAGIDQEQHDVGLRDGRLGLRPHARLKPVVAGVSKPAVSISVTCETAELGSASRRSRVKPGLIVDERAAACRPGG